MAVVVSSVRKRGPFVSLDTELSTPKLTLERERIDARPLPFSPAIEIGVAGISVVAGSGVQEGEFADDAIRCLHVGIELGTIEVYDRALFPEQPNGFSVTLNRRGNPSRYSFHAVSHQSPPGP